MPHFRPRMTFSLRTLFVIVTVLATGLGWFGRQYQIVKERRETQDLLEDAHYWEHIEPKGWLLVFEQNRNISWVRRMLGDQPLRWYHLPPDDTRIARVLSAFPEAVIEVGDGKGAWELVDRRTLSVPSLQDSR